MALYSSILLIQSIGIFIFFNDLSQVSNIFKFILYVDDKMPSTILKQFSDNMKTHV